MIEEILSTAEQEGYTPQEAAKAVRDYREQTASELKASADDPGHYVRALDALDEQVNAGIGKLRQRKLKEWTKAEFTDKDDALKFSDTLAIESVPRAEGEAALRNWGAKMAEEIQAGADDEEHATRALSALDQELSKGLEKLKNWPEPKEAPWATLKGQPWAGFVDSLMRATPPNEQERLVLDRRQRQMMEAAKDEAFAPLRAAQSQLPLALPDGRELGRFSPRKRGDGSLDVLLDLDTEDEEGNRGVTQRLLEIPAVTDADLAAEAESLKKKINAAEHYSTLPGATVNRELQDLYEQQRTLSKDSILSQRLAEKVKADPDLLAQVGNGGAGALWEEAVKGFAGAVLPAIAGVRDILGDEKGRDEYRALMQQLPSIFEGDTRREFARDPNAILPDAAEISGALGGIVPQAAAGAVPVVGAGLALAGMGATAYGAGLDEALTRADRLRDAAMAMPEGSEQRAQMLEAAESQRANARNVAAGGMLAEIASERILPEEVMGAVSGQSALRRGLKTVAGSAVEGVAAELGNQFVKAAAYGEGMDAGAALKAGVLEGVAGVGFGAMQAAGERRDRAVSQAVAAGVPVSEAVAELAQDEGAVDSDFDAVEAAIAAPAAEIAQPSIPSRQPTDAIAPDQASVTQAPAELPVGSAEPTLLADAGSSPAAGANFQLESVSEEQLKADEQRLKNAEEIRARQERQLSGTAGEFGTPDMFDATAGDMPLFSQPQAKPDPTFESGSKFGQTFASTVARAKVKRLPAHPNGGSDILDFVNQNPLKQARGSKSGLYDGMRREDLPPYWAGFLLSTGKGNNPDEVARAAADKGLLPEGATAKDLVGKIHEAIAARQKYRHNLAKQRAFERAQIQQYKKFSKAKAKGSVPVAVASLNPGDKVTIQGKEMEVESLQFDDEGHTSFALLKGGPEFGDQYLNVDEILMVDKFTQTSAPDNAPFSKASKVKQVRARKKISEIELSRIGLPAQVVALQGADAKKSIRTGLTIMANDYSFPPLMRQVAKVLLKTKLPADVGLSMVSNPNLDWAGQFDPNTRYIRVNMAVAASSSKTGDNNMAITFLHEVLHAATWFNVHGPKNAVQKASVKSLEGLVAHLKTLDGAKKWHYELSNVDEFISGVFTLPEFQRWLQEQPDFRSTKGLGAKLKNALERIFLEIARVVSGKTVLPGSALHQGITAALNLIEGPTSIEDAGVISIKEAEIGMLKSPTVKASLTVDADYLAAVQAGDMETAQRMVDDAAKAAGYNVGPVYHGKLGNFGESFKVDDAGMIHFGSESQAGIRVFDNARRLEASFEDGNIRSFYLRTANLKRVEDQGQWSPKLSENLKKQGFDGIVYANKYEGFREFEDVVPIDLREDSFAVFDPAQIKSADPVTYDENGNAIPLSQRFNPKSNSILYSPAATFPRTPGESEQRLLHERYFKLTGRKMEAPSYDTFTNADMKVRAAELVAERGFSEVLRLMTSSQGQATLAIDDALAAYVKYELLTQAETNFYSAGNDIDKIRAKADMLRAMALVEQHNSAAGSALAAVRLAGEEHRDPLKATIDALVKGQTAVIDPVLPVDQTMANVGAITDLAGDEATAELGQLLDDEDFETRLIPILQGLMPMRQPDLKEAVGKITGDRADFREKAMKAAADAVEKAVMDGQRPAAEKGALRTLLDNMNSILKAKLPKVDKAKAPVSYEDSIARAFLDAETERGLFEQSWQKARSRLMAKLTESGPSVLADELSAILPESPTMWFNPVATSKLFMETLSRIQGVDAARVEDALMNPQRSKSGVLAYITAAAKAAGMDSVASARVQAQMGMAWDEWLANAKGEALMQQGMASVRRRQKLLETTDTTGVNAKQKKQSQPATTLPALIRSLLPKLNGKSMRWADIFQSSQRDQRSWELDVYSRIRKHQDLQNLNQEEAKSLAREASKLWQAERRKVFQRELKRYADKQNPQAQKALTAKALPLLKLINLGAMEAQTFRDLVASEFGFKSLDSPEVKKVKVLSDLYQKAPPGVRQRMLAQKILETMRQVSGLSVAELMASYWTASVLSSWRTSMDIGLGIANGIEDIGISGVVDALRRKDTRALRAAIKAFAQRMPSAVTEAFVHLTTGDRAFMERFDAEFTAAMSGKKVGFNWAAGQLQAKGAKIGGALGATLRGVGLFMEFVGRVMTALGHVTVATTQAGARNLMLAHHPELAKLATTVTAADIANAEKRAKQEMLGGKAGLQLSIQEKAWVAARAREILVSMVPTEMLMEAELVETQAAQFAGESALEGPQPGFSLGAGIVQLATFITEKIEDVGEGLVERTKDKGKAAQKFGQLVNGMAKFATIFTGTRFVNVAGHIVNRQLSYVPGVGALRLLEDGTTDNPAKQNMIVGKQAVGMLATLLFAAAFLDEDEEEDGFMGLRLESNWDELTPGQKANKYAMGLHPSSIWWYGSDGKPRWVSYKQWGIGGLLAGAGAMLAHKNEKQGSAFGAVLVGLYRGSTSFLNSSSLSGVATLLGRDSSSVSTLESAGGAANKYLAQLAGGFVPATVKDIDYTIDPALVERPELWWQVWAAQMPVLRSMQGKRVNLFGKPVHLERGPLSRITSVGPTGESYRQLGRLNERGVFLTDPSAGPTKRRMPNGKTEEMSKAHKDRYQQAVGAAYEVFCQAEVPKLIAEYPDTKDGNKELSQKISDRTKEIRALQLELTYK